MLGLFNVMQFNACLVITGVGRLMMSTMRFKCDAIQHLLINKQNAGVMIKEKIIITHDGDRFGVDKGARQCLTST